MADSRTPGTDPALLRRALLWPIGLLLLLVLAAAAAVAWLGSASGMQWLAARTPLQIGSVQVSMDRVQGSLWQGLRVGRLRVVSATSATTLHDVALQWQPAALLQRRLVVRTLGARSVDVEQIRAAPPGGLPQLPATLRLPLAVRIDRLDIGGLRIGPPGALRSYGALTAELAYTQGRYALKARAATPWASVSLDGTLGDSAPYALNATLQASSADADPPASTSLQARGSLREVRLTGSLHAGAAKAELDARLTPFDATPIAQARLHSTHLDPALFDKNLPHAALDIVLDLGPSTAERLQGRISLRNSLPGPIDQNRLPLRTLQAELSGDAQHATVRDLVADLGAGGQLRGTLDWAQPTLQARLQAQDLNARALYGRLAATRLSGPLNLDGTAQQQTLHTTLAQPGWDIRLDAQRNGDTLRIDRLLLSALGSRLDASGTLSAAAPQPFSLQATLRNFDPARFGAYPEATLNAGITADGALRTRSARLALQLAPSVWRGRRFTGHAQLRVDPQRLWDVNAALQLGSNSLQAQGAFGRPADTLRWALAAPALTQIDPALQGGAQGRGVLSGGLQAPSGTLTLSVQKLNWARQLRLDRLQANSVFNTGNPTAGKAAPTVSALLDRLAGTLDLQLDGLRWAASPRVQAVQVAQLRARAQASAGLNGRIALDASLRDARAAGQTLQTAGLQIDGTRARHTIVLQARGDIAPGSAPSEPGQAPHTTHPIPLNLSLRAAGGWLGETLGWRGQVTALDNTGNWPIHLQAPAAFALATAPLRLQLSHAALELGGTGGAGASSAGPPQGGVIDIANLDYAPGSLRTAGRLQRVDTAYWLALADARADAVRSSLVLSGDWDLDVGASVNGSVHLQRDGGDVTVLATAPPMALGIGQFVLDMQAGDNRVSARMVLQTAQGTAQASGNTVLVKRGGLWGIAGDAPLHLDAGADIPSLAWAAPLLGLDYRAEGHIRLALQGRGTITAPQLSGSLDGQGLRFAWPAQGLDLKDGVLQAHFTGDRLDLDKLEFHGGGGLLTGSGSARLQNGLPTARLSLRADKLQALDRPDRQLVLSGTAQADLADKALVITTALTADRADIALPRNTGPTLSSDVVVLGRTPQAEKPSAAMPRAIRFDGTFDLGSDFHLYGMGLDAMLGGSVRVRASEGTPPNATGSIEVVKGDYAAYGQQLQVTQGRINFAGPLDNPGLNITATRPNLPTGIVVGVNITGSALRPVVKLSSTPAMPDTEILSWLVLGQPFDQVGPADIGVLQTAAAALLGSSDSAPLQTRLARALGLDSISVQSAQSTQTGTGLQGTIVTLSKRLSSRTLVSFSRGLDGVSSIFTIHYTLTRGLSVQTRTGTENAVDLFYTFEFD